MDRHSRTASYGLSILLLNVKTPDLDTIGVEREHDSGDMVSIYLLCPGAYTG